MHTRQKLHVLHVTHNMDFGGTEQVIRQIVNGVNSELFVCSIVCMDGRVGEIGQQIMANDVSVQSISRGPGLDRSAIAKLRALIKTTDVDVVHCHQYTPFCYGAFAAMLLGVKVIFTEHGRFYPDSFTWKRRLVNQILYRLADDVTCISAATRQALHTYEWIPKKRIKVIYNGVSAPQLIEGRTHVRKLLGISMDTLVLGTISRLDPIKNQSMMIEALASFKENYSDVALILAGDGPERRKLETLANKLGVGDRVYFTGFINNIADHLDAIDIFLLTSLSEGTSMTLLEAMALGKVIVATAVGGNVEVIDHDKTGILIESGNVQELIETLLRLHEDPEKRSLLSKAARVEHASRFSMDTMANHYQDLYIQP